MPRVSILIPAIRPQYLSQTIASALAQTFNDFECLIADNTDAGTLRELVSRFSDRRVRYLRTGGLTQGENFSRLWEASSGPLIKYLFDDDFMLPFCVAAMVRAVDETPGATFAFAQRHVVDSRGTILHSTPVLKPGSQPTLDASAVLPLMLGGRSNFIGEPSNVLINRAMFEDPSCITTYNGFRLRFLFDVGFYINALALGPCVGIGEFHTAFRKHAEQLSSAGVSPIFCAGLYEWELFLRGEFSAGRIEVEHLREGLEGVGEVYRRWLRTFPELQSLLEGLPGVLSRAEAGDRDLLDGDFEAVWRRMDAAIEARLASN